MFVALIVAAMAMPALAQDQDQDPPGVAGRLAFMQGPVSIQPGGVDDWVDAVVNRPLTTSDRVWTDADARAEVAMGNIKARMDQQTSLTITDLEDNITQLELDQGSLFVHVRRLFDGESVEIDSPNVAFTITQPGDYRFDVDPDNDTTYVSVLKGEGQGTGESDGVTIASGQQATFSGGNSGQYQMAELGEPDDFTNWNMQRDDHQDHARSEQYVSAGVVGYDDLDDNGSWDEAPEYGHVWYPRVAVGWAPYHTGHWAWIDPWGYTWVDDAPWGYAPFHYGRWVYVGSRWGWAPGPVVRYGSPGWVRPVYAPALVAFVGGGGFHVGVAVGGGGAVGWVPLGWGEPYYPSYHVSERYVRNVNVTNTHITNVTNIYNNYTVINNNRTVNNVNVHYANAGVPGGVTAVPASAMAGGRPVAAAAVRVDPKEMQNAHFGTTPGVAPTKEAVLGGRTSATSHVPPAAVTQRPVMAKHAPPPAPVKFEAKQQLLAKSNGRPLAASEVKTLPKVNRPAVMTAGKPRPPQAVAELNAAKPKGAASAPKIHPPAAKPTGPANAGKPGTPANMNRPATPANENRPGTPAAGRPIPPNTPAPKPGNATGNDRNAVHPSNAPNASEPTRGNEPGRNNEVSHPNQPATNAKPVPHPPTRENNPPSRTETSPTAHPANPPHPPEHEANPPRPPAHEANPPRPPAHEANPPRPPAHEANPPRPPAHEANPPRESKPPAKENQPSNNNKKDEKNKEDKPK
jgi:hypothetical protein